MLLIIVTSSCDKFNTCISGEGSIVSEELTISEFTGIDLVGVANVTITQGEEQKVVVESQSNIINKLKTSVSNAIWKIELENGCYKNFDLNVYITVPNLNKAAISGTGSIQINDFVNQSSLSLSIPGSGDIELGEYNLPQTTSINISGSGNIIFNSSNSSTDNLNINVGGSGNINAFGLVANNCDIDISGSTTCELSITNSLDVNSSGSATIYYKGAPSVHTRINPATNLIKINK